MDWTGEKEMENLKLGLHTYNGYKITTRMVAMVPEAAVFDPRYPRDPGLYKTTSLDKAMRWIDGYRNGEIWATMEREV